MPVQHVIAKGQAASKGKCLFDRVGALVVRPTGDDDRVT